MLKLTGKARGWSQSLGGFTISTALSTARLLATFFRKLWSETARCLQLTILVTKVDAHVSSFLRRNDTHHSNDMPFWIHVTRKWTDDNDQNICTKLLHITKLLHQYRSVTHHQTVSNFDRRWACAAVTLESALNCAWDSNILRLSGELAALVKKRNDDDENGCHLALWFWGILEAK